MTLTTSPFSLFLPAEFVSEVKKERESESLGEDTASGAPGGGIGGGGVESEDDIMSSFQTNSEADAGLQYRLQGTFTRWVC